jgi:hypothetical protein
MDFEQRLQRAIQRGLQRRDAAAQKDEQQGLSEEERKRRHSQFRLQLSEHIEHCIRRLPQHFPGFQFETLYGDRGWGAACKRDDLHVASGKRENRYSRLELTVRPYSPVGVLELTAKGTIHNKEVFNRSHFEKIADVDPDKFLELVDLWILEYAEMYAARNP